MTISKNSYIFGSTLATSEILQCRVVTVSIDFGYKHNYICETALKPDTPILGHPIADYVNNTYVDILGIVYIQVENQMVRFHVVDSFHSHTWTVASAILGRVSCIELAAF